MISTGTVLLLGLVFGLQHALEADHLAALATLVAREGDPRRVVRQGIFWGLGHTLTLLLFGGSVMVLGVALPAEWTQGLEALVGAMLVLLGADLLRRLRRERIHFHAHAHMPVAPVPLQAGAHAEGVDAPAVATHFHAHSHRGEPAAHDARRHRHAHRPVALRALAVGMVHGLAGSAALVLLTLQRVGTPWSGLLYVLLFGLGSVAGMAALSWAISVPLRLSAQRLTRVHGWLNAGVAAFSVGLGLNVLAAWWLG